MNISFDYQIDICPIAAHWLFNLELTCTLADDDFTIDAFDITTAEEVSGSIFDGQDKITSEEFCLSLKSMYCEEIRDDLERFKNDIYNEAVEAYNEQRIA